MQLHTAQSLIAKDLHRFRVLNCGRRFGKTFLAIEEMLGYAIAKGDRRVCYYAPTRDDARDIAWLMLIKKCENIIKYKNESRLEIKIMTIDGGESLISLYGWESVQERGKGRGLANDFLVLDEVASYRNFWEGWNDVLSPTLIDHKGSALFISTPKGFNHFYDLFNMQDKNPDFKSYHFSTYDNPHIPKEEIEREKIGKPEDSFAQEYMADFRKTEGLVYKDFDRVRHIYDDFTKQGQIIKRIAGIDFGFTNPTCVLEIEIDYDNTYWIKSEWYRRGKTNAEIIEYVKTITLDAVYPDPAEPDRILEMSNMGLNVQEVSKDISKGIDSVRQLFKTNKIRIHQSCANLISELETYRYPEKRANSNEQENPVKENDHSLDALRYALFNTAPIVVEDEDSLSLYSWSFK